jgi:curved DNA-binding protein CbpA
MDKRKTDKRRFRRYQKKVKCEVSVQGKSYRAETVDYSVEGIGINIENGPSINNGDVLKINNCYPGMTIGGEVIWSTKGKSSTKVGLRRMGMLSGSLQYFNLSDVILGLHKSNKTGVLFVVKNPLRKSIYIDGGEMVFAASNDPSDRLGVQLLKGGKITEEQYAQAGKISVKTGKRIGTVLVELGWLDARGLFQAVTEYVENIIVGLFGMGGAEFPFKEGPLPTKEVIKLSLSVGNLIYRGVKKIEDRDYITKVAPQPDVAVGFSPDPLYLFQDLKLDDDDKKLLKLIKGKKIVKKLIEESGMGEFETLRTMHALLSTRMLEVLEAREEAADIAAETVVDEAPKENYEEIASKIMKLYDEHKSLGYYGVLGVKETADRAAIKRSFYNMAKEFHPDKHFHLPDDMKEKLNTVFSYITTAYTTLTNPNLRSEYDNQPKTGANETKASNEQMAEQKYKEGMHELDRKKFADAAQSFGAAAYLNDTVAKYHFYLSIALSKDGRYKEAERAINRAIKAEPLKASYLAEAGHIYLALKLPKRAKGNFEKALNVDSNNKRALEGLEEIPAEG